MGPTADAGSVLFPYVAGRSMDLRTSSGDNIQVTITRVYPITMSPVMEVQMKTPGGHRNVLLKLFDRRFGGDRRRQPYNQEAEAAWQNCLRSGLAQNLLESLQEDEEIIKMARFQEDDDDDNDDSDEEEEEEEEDDERQLQEQEVVIYHATQKGYKSEVRAYTELKSLQGRCIPSFIASAS
ncbi:uncharacterized protein HRG_01700 [Hirsutella rhossiliensis]|uniref:Uncharacterized protein n=1 Tax=Hirsutella rhossiliensis TaxID=111463 RepID=A0A9P8SMM6_9HYPO|nr:uncharacterized protein HRG_01700 [Hirsutella rhossiliensis]KAH0966291.1 hypothetical protein HRG_01700 [Hirsutella rhossiliensis]